MLGFVLGSLPVCLALTLAGLTSVGARRRGAGVAAALLAGVVFPVTWVVWYARDERPYRRRLA